MPKLVQFTIAAADNPPVFVNPDLVRQVTSASAAGGSLIHFDGVDRIAVQETLSDVVKRLFEASYIRT